MFMILNITSFCFLCHFLDIFFSTRKHVLVSSSWGRSGSDSETEHSDRKRIHSDSETTEPKPAKMSKVTGVQKLILSFFSGAESSSSTSHAASNVSHGVKEKSVSQRSIQATQFNIDIVIKVYRFNHTIISNTIVSLSLLNQQLNDFKKSSPKLYRLEQEARRANIGSFEVNVGICGRAADRSLPTCTAKTEAEWQNVVARLQSQLHQYLLLSEYYDCYVYWQLSIGYRPGYQHNYKIGCIRPLPLVSSSSIRQLNGSSMITPFNVLVMCYFQFE